jgi:L-rhamnose mutarotase
LANNGAPPALRRVGNVIWLPVPPQHDPQGDTMAIQRIGSVIGIDPNRIEEYKRLHAAVWPDVLAANERANIRNYSIFLRWMPDGKPYLFSYFEYIGQDLAADMKILAQDRRIQQWWSICEPIQRPLADRGEGEWWASMESVFYAP